MRAGYGEFMDPMIPVPREALADLLRAAGSNLTPEEYASSLPSLTTYKKFPGRAKVCVVNKWVMAGIAGLSLLILPFSIDNETIIVGAGLCPATFFEFRTHWYFVQNDLRAPPLGFRN